ncbi:MAG: hypothetical protein FJ278_14450 [Planctomycetes bacterium]|nr:hypothetical protein [Planctomycetota bacterium]
MDGRVDIREIGIGIVGCGNIAVNAHLPSYRAAGFKVVAAADVRPEALERVKSAFGIPHVFTDCRDLLELAAVQVVDVAVPAPQHVPVARDAVLAGTARLGAEAVQGRSVGWAAPTALHRLNIAPCHTSKGLTVWGTQDGCRAHNAQ